MRLTENKLQVEVRKIVIFGTGKIGRSFIGQLFGCSSYKAGIFFILLSIVSCQQDNTADKSASVVKIVNVTKPSIAIVGNSTVADLIRIYSMMAMAIWSFLTILEMAYI